MFSGKHWISTSKKENIALILEESTPSAKGESATGVVYANPWGRESKR